MPSARAAAWPLVVGAVVLALGWLTVIPRSVTLYDGLGFPDEPYRYVHPPAGYRRTPPPSSAQRKAAAGSGTISLATAEQAPQVSLRLPSAALRIAAGSNATVSVQPVSAPVPAPTFGQIVSNVYAVSSSAPLNPGATGTLDMRAPTAGQPGPVFETLVGGHWEPAATNRVGNDIYRTKLTGFGDWALVQTRPVTRDGQYDFGTPDSSNGLALVLAVGGPLGVVVAVVVGIRSSRKRGRAARGLRTGRPRP